VALYKIMQLSIAEEQDQVHSMKHNIFKPFRKESIISLVVKI